MTRLSQAALAKYAGPAHLPAYDRRAVSPGIVHLGIGAFHRAHQAVYIDDCLSAAPDWGILGASLRRPDTRQALAPQDGLYTLAIRADAGLSTRIIGSVTGLLDTSDGPGAILDAIAAPATRIVSLTVTEKGYALDRAGGGLDTDAPDVADDLGGRPPRSVPGVLVRALELRRVRGAGGLTALSCDNLPGNGAALRRAVLGFADAADPDLAGWIAEHVTFPATMVDRITPATTDDDRAGIVALTGLDDAWPVVTEPFTQWVVEDRFAAGRPPLERAGVQMVADVAPFETMKLRLLNGAHSTLAYLAPRLGHDLVSGAVADRRLATFLARTAETEVFPTLDVPGLDLHAYWADLMERFRNRAIRHRLGQIAMDGSQKLPQRLLDTIAENRRAGRAHGGLLLGVAAWIAHLADAQGAVDDPMAVRFTGLAARHLPALDDFAGAILDIGAVFPEGLRADGGFRRSVAEQVRRLILEGPEAALAAV